MTPQVTEEEEALLSLAAEVQGREVSAMADSQGSWLAAPFATSPLHPQKEGLFFFRDVPLFRGSHAGNGSDSHGREKSGSPSNG